MRRRIWPNCVLISKSYARRTGCRRACSVFEQAEPGFAFDVDPFGIVGGVPAEPIGRRTEDGVKDYDDTETDGD
jgi:hypothetical protein